MPSSVRLEENQRIWYHEIFGFHVRTLANIIAIVSILISIPFYLLSPLHSFSLFYALILVINVGVLFADRFEKPWGYLAYLIFNGAVIFLGFILIFVLIYIAFYPPEFVVKQFDKNPILKEGYTVGLLLFDVFYVIFLLIGIYCWDVVRRARLCMIHDILLKGDIPLLQNIDSDII